MMVSAGIGSGDSTVVVMVGVSTVEMEGNSTVAVVEGEGDITVWRVDGLTGVVSAGISASVVAEVMTLGVMVDVVGDDIFSSTVEFKTCSTSVTNLLSCESKISSTSVASSLVLECITLSTSVSNFQESCSLR